MIGDHKLLLLLIILQIFPMKRKIIYTDNDYKSNVGCHEGIRNI